MDERNLALLFSQTNVLSSAIADSSYHGSVLSELRVSSEPLQLTVFEEEQIKDTVFPSSLRFSVPVNLRDSKKAYLTLLESEDVDEDDAEGILQSWGLANLYTGPPSPTPKEGDTAADDETTTEQPSVREEDGKTSNE